MHINDCINKKAPQTHSVHWGLKPPQKNITPSFLPSLLFNVKAAQGPLFRQFTPIYRFFMHPFPLSEKNRFFNELS